MGENIKIGYGRISQNNASLRNICPSLPPSLSPASVSRKNLEDRRGFRLSSSLVACGAAPSNTRCIVHCVHALLERQVDSDSLRSANNTYFTSISKVVSFQRRCQSVFSLCAPKADKPRWRALLLYVYPITPQTYLDPRTQQANNDRWQTSLRAVRTNFDDTIKK